jgi:hypothetical protein
VTRRRQAEVSSPSPQHGPGIIMPPRAHGERAFKAPRAGPLTEAERELLLRGPRLQMPALPSRALTHGPGAGDRLLAAGQAAGACRRGTVKDLMPGNRRRRTRWRLAGRRHGVLPVPLRRGPHSLAGPLLRAEPSGTPRRDRTCAVGKRPSALRAAVPVRPPGAQPDRRRPAPVPTSAAGTSVAHTGIPAGGRPCLTTAPPRRRAGDRAPPTDGCRHHDGRMAAPCGRGTRW